MTSTLQSLQKYLENIKKVKTAMGLDIGSIDTIKHYKDGLCYVIDVNKTAYERRLPTKFTEFLATVHMRFY